MLVVETFSADKIRLRIYALIGWGQMNIRSFIHFFCVCVYVCHFTWIVVDSRFFLLSNSLPDDLITLVVGEVHSCVSFHLPKKQNSIGIYRAGKIYKQSRLKNGGRSSRKTAIIIFGGGGISNKKEKKETHKKRERRTIHVPL
jgi:hypothetical protein